jgi:ABC-type uncharacterized transport system permease subunit
MILFPESSIPWLAQSFTWSALASAAVYTLWSLRRPQSSLLLCVAHALHALALIAYFSLTPARFGFAAALSMTAWLVVSVYLVEQYVFPAMKMAYASERWILASLGVPAVISSVVFPGTSLHWHGDLSWAGLRPLHWALGLAAYGLLAVATLHAWLLVRTEQKMREPQTASLRLEDPSQAAGLPVLKLERLMFRFVQMGFGLLSATWVVALSFSWQLGTWRWDHKAIFSLLAWLMLAGLLLGRAMLGWRGKRAAHWVYAASACLLLAYAGSRFVVEVLLQRA